MSDNLIDTRRRGLLKVAVTGVLAIPLGELLINRTAVAEALPHLAEDDPVAKSLSYVHVASSSAHSSYQKGRACLNCNLVQGDAGEWRGCSIFPGKAVNAKWMVCGLGWQILSDR